MEEAEGSIAIEGIVAVFTIGRIAQVQVIFRARFAGPPHFAPGVESLEAGLFAWPEIPWDRIAFPSVNWALEAWREQGGGPLGRPTTNPPHDPRGTGRPDPKTEERPL